MRVVVTAVLLAMPIGAFAAETRYPVPSDAYGIGHLTVKSSGAEEDYFSIKLRYPSKAVVHHYQKLLESWIECDESQPTWQSFGDLSGETPRFVHQLVQNWISRDNGTLVTLGIQYVSAGIESRTTPLAGC